MKFKTTHIAQIMNRTNLGLPLIGIKPETDTFPAEFFYIAHKFGGYFPTEFKYEAIRFDTKEAVEDALEKINKVYDGEWLCYMYAQEFDENTQKFDEGLDTLVNL